MRALTQLASFFPPRRSSGFCFLLLRVKKRFLVFCGAQGVSAVSRVAALGHPRFEPAVPVFLVLSIAARAWPGVGRRAAGAEGWRSSRRRAVKGATVELVAAFTLTPSQTLAAVPGDARTRGAAHAAHASPVYTARVHGR